MRAARLHETGGPENLRVEDIPDAAAAPGEVLVRLSHAALNHRDVFITQGLYPGIELPKTLGSDGAGTVAAIGAGVRGHSVGARVVINPMLNWGSNPRIWSASASILGMPREGTFAEFISVPAENVFATPQNLSDEQAAAIPLAGLTAYRATFTRGALQAGETVLITGIGGGVQTFVLLFARYIGARAVVTSSSDEKLAKATQLGAMETFNYKSDPQWFKKVKALGIDMAVDSAGGETLAQVIECVKPGGRVVIYGGTTGNTTLRPFSVFWHQRDVLGTSMGSPQDFAGMLALFSGSERPVIDRVFPLEDIVEAAQRLNRADQFGKVVLRITR